MTWLIPRDELTNEQGRAAELKPDEHRLILGSPGSGKTMVLLHRARYLADQYQVPPDRYRIFVFTRALKAYIRSALDDLALPDDCVTTFDSWCSEYYLHYIGKRLPWNRELKQTDFAEIRRAVWDRTQSLTATERLFDFVLVDEGQDLSTQTFETLKSIAQHITVFMDHKQQLYETGADEAGILRALGLRKRNLTLLEAYRCSPYIVQVAASFVRNPAEREAFLLQPRTAQTERQTPLLYLASDVNDERAHLIEMVRNRINKNDRIAILFPQKRHVYGYARALQEAGLEVEVPEAPWQSKKPKTDGLLKKAKTKKTTAPPLPTIDFSTSLPKLMPYPSAKGLTFDTVLMPRLIPGLFANLEPERLERWLFVGITRATQWVYFSTINDNRFMFLDRFQELERRKQATIKLSDDLLTGSPPTPIEPEEADIFEDQDFSDQF
ncbi:MAG: AAA family ATPase [Candidatus Contendobacter sp.]|nr:AAA family ATPase [Candidatus Contendobacter sp.]